MGFLRVKRPLSLEKGQLNRSMLKVPKIMRSMGKSKIITWNLLMNLFDSSFENDSFSALLVYDNHYIKGFMTSSFINLFKRVRQIGCISK